MGRIERFKLENREAATPVLLGFPRVRLIGQQMVWHNLRAIGGKLPAETWAKFVTTLTFKESVICNGLATVCVTSCRSRRPANDYRMKGVWEN